LLHRKDGPAWTERHPDGLVIEKYFLLDNLREDAAAIVTRYPDGITAKTEYWHQNHHCIREEHRRRGHFHREDRPAVIENNPNGTRTEQWYRDGCSTATAVRPVSRKSPTAA
jgi:hypothetical protein